MNTIIFPTLIKQNKINKFNSYISSPVHPNQKYNYKKHHNHDQINTTHIKTSSVCSDD